MGIIKKKILKQEIQFFDCDSAKTNRAELVNDFLRGEGICRMDRPTRSPELKLVRFCALGRTEARRLFQHPPGFKILFFR